MRGLWIGLFAVMAMSPAVAQDAITAGERTPLASTPPPAPLAPPPTQAEIEAGRWAQNILDGAKAEQNGTAPKKVACEPMADRTPQTEVSVAVGTGGYKSTSLYMNRPISNCGQVSIGIDMTDGGNSGGHRRR